MGLPLGPTFANIFMSYNEKEWLNDCPYNFKPFLYRRFVDDTFFLFREPSDVNLFLEYINGKHPNIKFTMDQEKDRKLPFLDVLITRENNKFKTSVYRKETFTELGLSYFSFTPFLYKINAIKCLIFRAYNLSSNFTDLHREFDFIREYFVGNGFPSYLIFKYIRKFISTKINASPDNQNLEPEPEKYFLKLPFFGQKSIFFKNELQKLFRKYFPEINIYICFRNEFTIQTFFRYKDTLPPALRSSLIYKFSCETCSRQYIGSTVRNLYMRVNEHAGKGIRTENLVARPVNSSIRDHKFICDPKITLENLKIINSTIFPSDLSILESIYLRREKPSIDDMNSVNSLIHFYFLLFCIHVTCNSA